MFEQAAISHARWPGVSRRKKARLAGSRAKSLGGMSQSNTATSDSQEAFTDFPP
jgi:hypothetical protein